MNPDLPTHRRIIAVVGGLAAMWFGWKVANGDYFWPGAAIALLVPLLATYLSGIRPDVLVAGVVLFGYLVGNRGFAQLNVPGLPLLPGEIALGLGVVIVVLQSARTKTPIVRRDALNGLLLLWIVTCGLRLPTDVRQFGFLAIRDFALVYYGLFFFLGQSWSADARSRRLIEICLSAGLALTVPVTALFVAWPDLFSAFTVAGVPVIFVKGDVSSGFMVAGVFWFGALYARQRKLLWVLLMASCGAGALFSNSRAAVVALVIAMAWLVPLGERRMLKALLLVGAIGLFGLLVDAVRPRGPGKPSQAFRIYESFLTIADFGGARTPTSIDLGDKADNNRFRLVWWEAILEQTLAEGPWLGLGFGQDLADEFLRRYYTDSSDDFTTRSPHNFVVTVFARTGIVGFLCFSAMLIAALARMWRASRLAPDSGTVAVWLAPMAIFISACFGVVLEGPMGAVVFWTLLGMAAANSPQALDAGQPALPDPESTGAEAASEALATR